MRRSELQRAMVEEFGDAYAGVLMRDHWLAEFNGTAQEALDRGVTARAVWQAVCVEMQVPEVRRYGRGLREPRE